MELDRGSVWLSGGVFFELGGTVYLHLGFRLNADGDQVEGATEIIFSELETERQRLLSQRRAA